MAYTKRWFVTKAFSKIGYANYEFDLQPEQLQDGLDTIDSMMAGWDGKGIRVGWSIPNDEDASSLDDEVDVPYQAREAIYLQAALRIAPDVGKVPSNDLKSNAKDALDTLMLFTAQPVPMQFPNTLPSGAGNKPWRTVNNPFLGPPVDPIVAGGDSPIDFGTIPVENGAQ